jgi:hypothetical protein
LQKAKANPGRFSSLYIDIAQAASFAHPLRVQRPHCHDGNVESGAQITPYDASVVKNPPPTVRRDFLRLPQGYDASGGFVCRFDAATVPRG